MRTIAVGALFVLIAGCGADSPRPPASLSLDELDELAADIQANVADIDEAFCDSGGGDPMANCYIGIATSDEAQARGVVCSSVVPIVEEWTSGSVSFIAFDSRDDQTIALIDCG